MHCCILPYIWPSRCISLNSVNFLIKLEDLTYVKIQIGRCDLYATEPRDLRTVIEEKKRKNPSYVKVDLKLRNSYKKKDLRQF